jgi:hypothetical protein
MTTIIDKNIVNETPEQEGTTLQWESFPIEVFPPVLQNYCQAVSRSTRTDPAYTAAFVLPVVSSAIGANIVLQATQDWQVPAIIWSLLVADSGSGKTPTWKLAVKPLLSKQREYSKQFDDAMRQYESALSEWKKSGGEKPEAPKHRFCHISDTTTAALIPILSENPCGVLASYNEASTWLGSFSSNGKDEALYCDVFDGSTVQVNRKTGTRSIEASHTNTSITGGVQPNSLYSILQKNPQFYYSGFLARFLLSMPPDVPRYFSDDPIPDDVSSAYSRLIDTLLTWRTDEGATPDNPYPVQLTPEAKEMFADFHNSLADDRNSLPAGVMKSILSKMSGYVLRIALVLHITEVAGNSTDEHFPDNIPAITAETMGKAIILTEWYRREGQRILQRVQPHASVTVDREVTAILKHVQNQGGETTARLVSQYVSAFSGRGGSERAAAKLEQMGKDGLLTAHDRKATNGRPVKVYSLIP